MTRHVSTGTGAEIDSAPSPGTGRRACGRMNDRARALYARLPLGLQEAAIAAVGVRYRRDRLGPGFAAAVAEFRERDRWSIEQMDRFVESRLRELLAFAFLNVRYYHDRWSHAGIELGDLERFTVADLARLPSTPKDALRADPEVLSITDRGRERRMRQRTSGSTGTPTTVYVTARNMRTFTASREVRSYGWAGTSIRMPRSTIGARMVVPRDETRGPFHRYNRVEKQVYFSAFHISPANIARYVEAFDRYRPQVLTGLAQSHFLLAHLMLEKGLRLDYRPRAAILSSERLTERMRQTIEAGFGTRVFEEYSSVENCVLATECERGRLHVSPDFGILEIVDETGRPVPPGEPGRFTCTGLLGRIQPLIRFEIGDLGAWCTETCPCGRDHMPVLQGIVGRENDVVLTRDGRRVASGDEIFTGLEHVIEGQLVQESLDRFTVRVVVAPGFGPQQERRLERALRERVGDVAVGIERVAAIERTASGKFRSLVCRVAEDGNSGPAGE